MHSIEELYSNNPRFQNGYTMEKHLMLLLACIMPIMLIDGQDKENSLVTYDANFKFKEGIYPDFERVKHNTPIPKSRILTEFNYLDKDFFDRVLSQSKVYYYDNLGNKIELKSNSVWGYARNGFLYVRVDNGFYRIAMMGSICHFIAYKTYETYNTPYNSYYSTYPYSSYSPTSTSTEMHQYLLDFSSGNIVDYSAQSVEFLLMKDPELHDEYVQLSKKKKKQLKFLYIRKYNERNPLTLYRE